jgi:uncharacterized protein (DUF58 family)
MKVELLRNDAPLGNFELLARQVVEGFITGLHQSPFHGFSVEFAEHRLYNTGESTRHIDWKLFARTDKLYIKRYDEETNLRCHLIMDNSASMHFPESKNETLKQLNKIGYSAVAAASLMHLLKKQRDAIGLSVYSDTYEFYAPEKGSQRHHRRLLAELEKLLTNTAQTQTLTHRLLHEIADRLHKRSLVFVFTDMWQAQAREEALFEALRYLKFNKHEVVLFHVYDSHTELSFEYDNRPKRFVDVETGESVQVFAESVKENYQKAAEDYFHRLKLKCLQYRIDYAPIDIRQGFYQVLSAYLIKRNKLI